MNMKRRALGSCLSFLMANFSRMFSLVIQFCTCVVADVCLSRSSSVSGNHLHEYRTGLHCLEITVDAWTTLKHLKQHNRVQQCRSLKIMARLRCNEWCLSARGQSWCSSNGEGWGTVTVRNVKPVIYILFFYFPRKTACGFLLEALVHLQALVLNIQAPCSQMYLLWENVGTWICHLWKCSRSG